MYDLSTYRIFPASVLTMALVLAGCASVPPVVNKDKIPHKPALVASHPVTWAIRVRGDDLQREAMAGTELPPPTPLPLNDKPMLLGKVPALENKVTYGSGQFVRDSHPSASPYKPAHADRGFTFNFENQPIQDVVKAILGDLLKKNYTIVPGVQGNISFSTSEPVTPDQALPILETLLSWTKNALVRRQGGYVVMPEKEAGNHLVLGLGAPAPQDGLQARLFTLHYISANEMEKLLQPFARQGAILIVDKMRNILVLAGTPEELNNYARTIRTFDVDWLLGMSVGLFSLQHVSIDEIIPELDKIFGTSTEIPADNISGNRMSSRQRMLHERRLSMLRARHASSKVNALDGSISLAGMLRFIPIKSANALLVISIQPRYVEEVGRWIAKIDQGGGNQLQLFIYNVRNMKASDMARYLAQIYASGGGSGTIDNGGRVGPGLGFGSIGTQGGNPFGMGSNAGSFGSAPLGQGLGRGFGGSINMMNRGNGASQDRQYSSADGSVRISSVTGNNQLLVRARPSQWQEIEEAIRKLDHVPLQVQIETRILEVSLRGEFALGVQWYLAGLTGSRGRPGSSDFQPGQPYRHRQIAIGQGGNGFAGSPLFYSFLNKNMQVAIRAMESSKNTKTLSAPSLVVMNNQLAQIMVGNRIPVVQNYVNTGSDEKVNTIGQVQYQNTGVMLNVIPRVNPGGLVYLDIQQGVSNPTSLNKSGNYTIAERSMKTEVAVQSGQTVLLGGLIQQDEGFGDDGVPFLSHIPVIGRLFGSTSRHRNRTELIVLITPRVIRNGIEARQIVNDYQRGFESLEPLRAAPLPEKVKRVDKKMNKTVRKTVN